MNAVLELQKLAQATDGKGQAAEATITIITIGKSTLSVYQCNS
ncbi:class III lanthipeptide [Paenibacillus thiaminolyticus]|nr:class III lanthipeptide [Paenibacillus thiaminolyticus]MCY9614768.1 class III lanthipeptide [Paenibacillus thiaminolyticus]MCY9619940.1 class III lanthipeptide [Paenibacillus thiaminolyticus]MCY9630016.1 class III lanthipeptide [Paenibacillus thiaminolyticus]MCY9649403.1 class III lanthipeptide [Paenibacillus thiaminolyticus]MCY9655822.1 class III lanthipeptide [Paenibacillus thiaminolyticus]